MTDKIAAIRKIIAKHVQQVGSRLMGCAEAAHEIAELFEATAERRVAEPVETIVCAAIRVAVAPEWRERFYNGVRLYPDHLILSAPPPARHGTIMHPAFALIGHGVAFEDQGFLTSTGRYVEREEALQIALASGQPMIDHPSRHDVWLFSEDLW